MQQRVGIFSGTFDPIHRGHIAFAREAVQSCGLDEVVFLPERKPRSKTGVTDISHRIALIEQAVQSAESLRVLSLASEQFTVNNTLPELRAALGNAHLTFLVGSDIVRTSLHRWDGLEVLFNEASFAVGMRDSDSEDEVHEIMTGLQRKYNADTSYTLIRTPYAYLASSQIKRGPTDIRLV